MMYVFFLVLVVDDLALSEVSCKAILSCKTFLLIISKGLMENRILKPSKVKIGRRKLFVLFFSIVLVIAAVLFYLNTKAPNYPLESGTIYIKADGSLDPSNSPIRRDGDLYTLIHNFYGPIVVERDNIIVDGAGYTVQGVAGNDSRGVILSGRNNVTLKNLEIRGFWYGIYLEDSSNSSVSGNDVNANIEYGIWLNESSGNVLSGNSIAGNSFGVYLEDSLNNSVSGNSVTGSSYGVYLYHSSSNILSENNVTTNYVYGIWLHESSYNSISGNSVADNGYGIYFLRFCESNSISGNNIAGNKGQGIWLHQSSYNSIVGNIVADNGYGIFFSIGFAPGSSDNLIYHNNFVNNAQQIYIENTTTTHVPPPPPVNVWDDGVEGNYWSDYTGVDGNGDGLGDSPYVINASSTNLELKQYARYPLMGRFYDFNVSSGRSVNIISNSTIENFAFFDSNSTISMHVAKSTADQTCGFCRICVPHALMNETYHIAVNGTEPDYVNYTLYDDGYSRWIYFSYKQSDLLTVIVFGTKSSV
jgi:parallel beta-helix repeat protein